MGLAEIQHLLAQIYTNSSLRAEFFADPIGRSKQAGLSEEDIAEITQISHQQIETFARSLRQKRVQEVEKMLPLTRRVLGDQFDMHFCKYADKYVPNGTKKHQLDAIKFSEYLNEPTVEIEDWIRDLARFELLPLRSLSERFIFEYFNYPIARIAKNLDDKNRKRNPTCIIYLRLTRDGRTRRFIF